MTAPLRAAWACCCWPCWRAGTCTATLYPLLHSLEAQGWVTSSDGVANGRTRRYYAITRDGRAALAEQQAGWYAYADAVRGVLEGGNPCGA